MKLINDYEKLNGILLTPSLESLFYTLANKGLSIESDGMVKEVSDVSAEPTSSARTIVALDINECKAVSASIVHNEILKLLEFTSFLKLKDDVSRGTTISNLVFHLNNKPSEDEINSCIEYYAKNSSASFIPFLEKVGITEDELIGIMRDLKYDRSTNRAKDLLEILTITTQVSNTVSKKYITLPLMLELLKVIMNGGKISREQLEKIGYLKEEEDGETEVEIYAGKSLSSLFMGKSEYVYNPELELSISITGMDVQVKKAKVEKDIIGTFDRDTFSKKDITVILKEFNAVCSAKGPIVENILNICGETHLVKVLDDITRFLLHIDEKEISDKANMVAKANDISEFDALNVIRALLNFIKSEYESILVKRHILLRAQMLTNKIANENTILAIYKDMLK